MTGVAKGAAIMITAIVGLDIYARWTGKQFSLDLLAPNGLGSAMSGAAPATVATPPAASPGGHWYDLFTGGQSGSYLSQGASAAVGGTHPGSYLQQGAGEAVNRALSGAARTGYAPPSGMPYQGAPGVIN